MSIATHVYQKLVPQQLPPANSFSGQKVLITGGTGGIGLAAAVHFANLGADEVIITSRNVAKGEKAKRKIAADVSASGQGATVTVMELDMDQYSSCVKFVETVKQHCRAAGKSLDVAIFNAGSMPAKFEKSPEGWELTLQATLSTLLLAALMLPWMKEARGQRQSPAHMVFVSSGTHVLMKTADLERMVEEDGGVLAHFNKPGNFPTQTRRMYPPAKLLLMYGINELADMALDSGGQPQVIVNSLCPGPVKSELARSLTADSVPFRIATAVFQTLVSKSPDVGSRIYLAAAMAGPDQHGAFLVDYWSATEYSKLASPLFKSTEGRKLQAAVWGEMTKALSDEVPELKGIVG